MRITFDCTPAQKEVVTHPTEPNTLLNVIAGPGSGKTRTLCSRIAYLLSKDGGEYKPEEILVLSLTNRAVDDFRMKFANLVGPEFAEQAKVLTFHAFAAEVIADKYPDWMLLEDEELRRLCDLVPKAGDPRKASTLSSLKEVIRMARHADSFEESQVGEKYGYDRQSFDTLRSLVGGHTMFTYDDLLYECNELLKKGRELPYKVVVVDEFQDVYPLLAQMIILLGKDRHLTISGDPNQSIYGFLGASPEKNWKLVASNYTPEHKKLVTLSDAFRATPELLELSRTILGERRMNISNCVKDSANLPPIRMSFDSQDSELQFIYKEIQRLVRVSGGKIHYSDIAVLSFTNQEVNTAYQFFKEVNKTDPSPISVNRLNATPVWLRTQLSILIQYMKVLIDPRQNFALLSCLNLLNRVGLATVNSIYKSAVNSNQYVWDYLVSEDAKHAKIPKSVREFTTYLQNVQLDQNSPNSIMKTLLEMADRFGLRRKLITAKLSNRQLEEDQSCLRSIHQSLKQNLELKPPTETLLRFYLSNYNSHVLLNPQSNFLKLYQADEVNFSTIHTSKGLEFPIVFVLSPNNFNLSNSNRRRVVYVGLTRASALLYFNKLHNQYVYSIDGPANAVPTPMTEKLKHLERAARAYIPDLDKKTHKVVVNHAPPNLTAPKDLSRLLGVMGRNKSRRMVDLSIVNKIAPLMRKFK